MRQGWDQFDRRERVKRGHLQDGEDATQIETEEAKLDASYLAVFETAEGQRVLEHLRSITVDRVVSPEPGNESALRHVEGQRHLVQAIQRRLRKARDRK